MGTPSSMTRTGKHEPWELQVSRGQIAFHKRLLKFGYNALINDTEETIWEGGGIYSYPSSALAMTVTSASGATDNGVKITIQGLDADYNEQSVEVTLAGSGTATTTETFIRVFRAFVSGSTAPVGAITIANGGTTYAYINGDNQTLMALWTVPAGYTAYLVQTDVTVMTEANNKFGKVRVITREPGGVFRTQDNFSANNIDIVRSYAYPLPIPEKTDIEFRGIASSSNALLQVSATFEIIYIENEIPPY